MADKNVTAPTSTSHVDPAADGCSQWEMLSSPSDAGSTTTENAPKGSPAVKAAGAHTGAQVRLDLDYLTALFPEKPAAKVAAWHATLQVEEIETAADAVALFAGTGPEGAAAWASLSLPMAIKARIRQSITGTDATVGTVVKARVDTATEATIRARSATPATPPPPLALAPLQQIDLVVLDVSGSMKARSEMDPLKTREDVSKLAFHTVIDRVTGLEMDHAVGLIAFGQRVELVSEGITREYERFHDELGRLDARQNQTRLWDAILAAKDELLKYRDAHAGELMPSALKSSSNKDGDDEANTATISGASNGCRLRIFVLSDGQDNGSQRCAWEAARECQRHGIVLDAVPLANENPSLQAVASATGGYCIDIESEQQLLSVFEREALLHVAYRHDEEEEVEEAKDEEPNDEDTVSESKSDGLTKVEETGEESEKTSEATKKPAKIPKERALVSCHADLLKFMSKDRVVKTVATAQPSLSVLQAPVLTATAVQKKLSDAETTDAGSTKSTKDDAGHRSIAAQKRILKEYCDLQREPMQNASFFVSADDVFRWKVLLRGPSGTPYENGWFLLTAEFPSDYPAKVARVKFITPIYHCNINNDGTSCHEVGAGNWSSALSLSKVVLAILDLLVKPNAADPLDAFKADLYNTNRTRYLAEAAAFTKAEALPSEEAAKKRFKLE